MSSEALKLISAFVRADLMFHGQEIPAKHVETIVEFLDLPPLFPETIVKLLDINQLTDLIVKHTGVAVTKKEVQTVMTSTTRLAQVLTDMKRLGELPINQPTVQ